MIYLTLLILKAEFRIGNSSWVVQIQGSSLIQAIIKYTTPQGVFTSLLFQFLLAKKGHFQG